MGTTVDSCLRQLVKKLASPSHRPPRRGSRLLACYPIATPALQELEGSEKCSHIL